MIDDKRAHSRHSINIERRQTTSVTGVIEVVSFDEEVIIADTEMGVLILRGVNLHVKKLNLESGELEVGGEIVSIAYEEQVSGGRGKPSFLRSLFKWFYR